MMHDVIYNGFLLNIFANGFIYITISPHRAAKSQYTTQYNHI